MNPSIARAINQALIKSGFDISAQNFKAECLNKKIQLVNIKKSSTARTTTPGTQRRQGAATARQQPPALTDIQKKLLSYFDRGENTKFFKLFHNQFGTFESDNYHSSSPFLILEFHLQIFFATLPLRKTPPDRLEYRERLTNLKAYLEEGNGSRMAANCDLLPFFALPYVHDPLKHPVFQELVSKKYAKNLREDLVKLIQKASVVTDSSESDDELKLAAWKNAYDAAKHNPSTSTQQVFEPKSNDLAFHDDYFRVVDIAAELVTCLNQCSQGQAIPSDTLSNLVSQLVEANTSAEKHMKTSRRLANHVQVSFARRNQSLNAHLASQRTSNEMRKIRHNSETMRKTESTGNLIPTDPKARNVSPPLKLPQTAKQLVAQLNVAKISNQLIKNPVSRMSALLLQALRFQLTLRHRNLADAKPVIEAYAQKDILLLKNRKMSVVAIIVNTSDQTSEAKEELARLLNAIASFKTGRDYLLGVGQGRETLYQLALALRTKKLTAAAADHTLAALQRLSVRGGVQKELVLSGMLEWVMTFIETDPPAFGMEYGVALLANLCLHSSAQSTVFRYKERLIALAAKILRHQNSQLLPSIANALFGMFAYAKMRSTGREAGLESIITERLLRHPPVISGDIEAQLSVVVRILQGDLDNIKRPRETDEDNEEDYVEAEVDSTDTLVPNLTELFGEQLLIKRYSLTNANANHSSDDVVAPPGSVPRRYKTARPTTSKVSYTRTGRRTGVITKDTDTKDPVSVPVPPVPSDARMDSVTSCATFICENSRRKPLLANSGLKSAVLLLKPVKKSPSKSAPPITATNMTSTHHNTPQAVIVSHANTTTTGNTTERKNGGSPRKKLTSVGDGTVTSGNTQSTTLVRTNKHRFRGGEGEGLPDDATTTTTTPGGSAADVTLTMLSKATSGGDEKSGGDEGGDDSINTSDLDYVSIFGSRPKVARTPEQRSVDMF